MPPIEGNFDDELEILWDGRGVAARGPLRWFRSNEENEEKSENEDYSVVLHVAVMQDGGSAMGRTGDDVPEGANEFLVAAAVQGDGTLTEGPAIATGLALVRGDSVAMYQWSHPVMLTQQDDANERRSADLVEVLAVPRRARAQRERAHK
jgi:hypothetical protein